MANTIVRQIVEEVKIASSFAIIADETFDISRQEWFVIRLRWVDEFYEIHKEKFGMYQMN